MIKIWNEKEKEPTIFIDLKKSISPEGVTVYAKDNDGNDLYSILTIHNGGIYFHNLKNLDTPFATTSASFELGARRIQISRM